MNYKLFISVLLLSLALISGEWYVPVVAKAAGGYGSQWQTSLAIYNAGHKDISLQFSFIPTENNGNPAQKEIYIRSGESIYFDDFLSEFPVFGSGAVKISGPDWAFSNLGFNVKVYNISENGRFGQAINVLQGNRILQAPLEYFLILPENENERFNFGLLSLENSSIKFQLLDQNGIVISEVVKNYNPSYHIQYNQGYKNFFGTEESGKVIKAVVSQGKVILYGSQIDNRTNDGAFFLAENLKSNEAPYLEGVDAGSNGTLDLKDEDRDNVLDSPVVFSENYPFNYVFIIKAKDPEGDPVIIKLLNAPRGMVLLSSSEGKVYYDPDKGDVNKTINLEVELSDGLSKSIAVIPLQVNP